MSGKQNNSVECNANTINYKTILLVTEGTYRNNKGKNISVQQRWLRGAGDAMHFIEKSSGAWCQFEGRLDSGLTIKELLTKSINNANSSFCNE